MKKPIRRRFINDMTVQDAALFYATKMEWPVIPLYGIRNGKCACTQGAQCSRPGKHPKIKNWREAASTNPAVIKDWFNDGTNVGVVTGARSGVMVIDIDLRSGGKESFAELYKRSKLPKTARSVTGGGHHLFFEHDKTLGTSQGKLADGIDVRAEGGMVVMPPSTHVSGRKYRWLKDHEAHQVSLAQVPQTWLARAVPSRVADDVALVNTDSESDSSVHREGGRNNALTSLAGRLVNAGLSSDGILATLMSENERRCQPPLQADEVRRIASSISCYPAHVSEDEGEAFAQMVLDTRFESGSHLILGPDRRLWQFAKTHWIPLDEDVLANIVLQVSSASGIKAKMNKTALIQQVKTLLRAKVSSQGDPLRFKSDPSLVINCRNGELWLTSKGSVELKPHSAKSYLRHTMEVDYNPDAICDSYDTAINDIFAKSSDSEGLIDFWHEICGYVLQPSRRSALIVIGRGAGSNGKTKLAGTLARLLGHELVVAKAVQDLDKDRFGTANLHGKYLFVDDDVKAGIRLPDGALKKISEEKLMTGEYKFGSHFSFTCRVLPILLCNNFPSVADLSPGLQRRLAVVPFDNQFLGTNEDALLFNRIWQREMSGILNRYLAGLQRVVRRGFKFEPPPVVIAATTEFLRGANPLPDFIASKCKTGTSLHWRLDDLYEVFVNWTKANGITFAQQKSSFKKNLEHLGCKAARRNDGVHMFGLALRD